MCNFIYNLLIFRAFGGEMGTFEPIDLACLFFFRLHSSKYLSPPEKKH
jgi:hypothetical protein